MQTGGWSTVTEWLVRIVQFAGVLCRVCAKAAFVGIKIKTKHELIGALELE